MDGVTLGPAASEQWRHAPEHLAMVLARYRAAAALIGNASTIAEFGCGEGIGARILARGRTRYRGFDVDPAAIEAARRDAPAAGIFHTLDVLDLAPRLVSKAFDAIVALDVIEHLGAVAAGRMVDSARLLLARSGVFVVGTPSRRFDHLASPASRAAHAYTFDHDELRDLLSCHFAVVQSFGVQDTALHFGHPDARHYLLMAGIGPRS